MTGRSSGRSRHAPVTAHDFRGRTYLWSPYGDHAQRYRTVVADPVVSELRRFDVTFLHSCPDEQGIADTPEDIAANPGRPHLRRPEPTQEQGPHPLDADRARLWLVALGVTACSVRWGRRRRAAG